MDHRPFEDWLLSEEPLTTEHKSQLQAHLRTCKTCSTLAEVNLALKGARQAAPVPGFTARFQIRLAAQQKAQRLRNQIGFFVLFAGVMAVFTWLAWPFLRTALASPADLLGSWLVTLVDLWLSLRAFGDTVSVFLRVINGFIPFYVWGFAAFAFVGGSLLWVTSMKNFNKTLQGV
ncbi:MAG: hypothetical protein JXB85_08550 [Anaerolineales bacterium]|nr:hypothetical protein [Anaerolineales bacterium]